MSWTLNYSFPVNYAPCRQPTKQNSNSMTIVIFVLLLFKHTGLSATLQTTQKFLYFILLSHRIPDIINRTFCIPENRELDIFNLPLCDFFSGDCKHPICHVHRIMCSHTKRSSTHFPAICYFISFLHFFMIDPILIKMPYLHNNVE